MSFLFSPDDTTTSITIQSQSDQSRNSFVDRFFVEETRQTKISAAIVAANGDKVALRNSLRECGILYDTEVAAKIGNDPTFTTNKSSWSTEKLQAHFCSLLPAFGTQKDPKAICGYKHDKKSPRPITRAIFCRYLDIGHVPWGYNRTFGNTNLETPILPKLFALDLDANKPAGPFRKLFGDIETAADIFERHDIPRPLCTITNPLTKNAHAVYGVRYSADELSNPYATAAELKRIIKEITKWIGGDPGYAGFVIRGPAYVAGWHKAKQSGKCSYIDTVKESTFHETTWYEPHRYSLDELRELATFLQSLHEPKTNVEFITALGSPRKVSQQPIVIHAVHEDHVIPDGKRGTVMFDTMREYAYPVAWKFKDVGTFAQHLFETFSVINVRRCSPPLPACAIRATTYSVAKFCFMKGFKKPVGQGNNKTGYTDEDRAFAHLIKYGPNHITQKEIAAAKGVCVRTIARRNKKAREAAALLLRNQTFFGKRSNGHQRDTNGRIVYTSIPFFAPWDMSSRSILMIRDDDSWYANPKTFSCITATGPPDIDVKGIMKRILETENC